MRLTFPALPLGRELVGLGLRAFAALVAAFGLLMLELAAYFALVAAADHALQSGSDADDAALLRRAAAHLLQAALTAGTWVFSTNGRLVGLTMGSGQATRIVPADAIQELVLRLVGPGASN